MNIELTKNEQEFVESYIEAMYFTETGDCDQPDNDCDLDEDFERESIIECLAFYHRIKRYLVVTNASSGQAGHDFWLTRNGHGTGFWDRDCYWNVETDGDYKDMFTKIAESFGESDFVSQD